MINIPVKEFNSVVYKVLNGALVSSELEAYRSVRLEVKDSTLKISSYSQELFVATFLKVDCKEDVKHFFVLAKNLFDITASFTDGNYKLVIDEGKLKISCGRSRFSLPILPDIDIPEPNTLLLPMKHYTEVADVPRFIKNIKRVASAIESDPKRDYSDIVCVTGDYYIRTNGVALALATNKEMQQLPRPFNIREDSFQKILKVFQSASSVKYCLLPDTMVFWCERSFVSVQQVKTPYPQWQILVDKGYEKYQDSFSVPSSEFKKELHRMAIMDSKKKEGDELLAEVKDSELRMTVNNTLGKAEAAIKAECQSEISEVKFCLPQLVKGCNGFTGDRIHVKILSRRDPVLFYEEGYSVYVSQRQF